MSDNEIFSVCVVQIGYRRKRAKGGSRNDKAGGHLRSTEGVVKSRVTDQSVLLLALTLQGPSGGHCVELQMRPPTSITSSGPSGPTACLSWGSATPI